jgi:hypothetical protein
MIVSESATLGLHILEIAMDDKDKNVIGKMVDKINDVVEKIVTTASDARATCDGD